MPTGWRPDDVKKLTQLKLLKILTTMKNMTLIQILCFCFGVAFQLMVHLAMQFHLIYLLGYIGKDLAYDQASFIDILAGYQPFNIIWVIFYYFLFGHLPRLWMALL